MSDTAEPRARTGAVVVGVMLSVASLLSLLFTIAFIGEAHRGLPAAGGAVQWTLTSGWLIATSAFLFRRAPARLFGIAAALALFAGVVGLATWVPLSFGNADQEAIDELWDPLGFVSWSLCAAIAGIGHVRQAQGGRGATVLHVVALLVGIAGVLYVVARHA